MNTLFSFRPSKTGDTSVFVYHPEGYYQERDGINNPRYDRFSLLHNTKAKRPPTRFSLFCALVHWMRIYRMQNGRRAVVINRIQVAEAGCFRAIEFRPWILKFVAWVLNRLPERWRRSHRVNRFGI